MTKERRAFVFAGDTAAMATSRAGALVRPMGTGKRSPRLLVASLLLGVVPFLVPGCPASGGGSKGPAKPTAEHLAEDVEALSREAARVRVPEATDLVEAYIAHHRAGGAAARESLCLWLGKAGLSPGAAAARLSAITIPGRERLRGFVAALLALDSCDAPAMGPRDPAASPRPAATAFRPGHFEGAATRTREGHTETVKETWLLVTVEDEVSGWVLRRVTRRSTDGRRFVCSGEHQAVTSLVAAVSGHLRDGRLTLESKVSYVNFGPCAPTEAPAIQCSGAPTAAGLLVGCPEEMSLTRTGDGPAKGAGQVFAWRGRTPRAEGGRDEISETWHILASGDILRGFYFRETQASALPGKTFSCSGQASFASRRLFLVTGTRGPAGITMQELAAFRIPDPCDREKITLDRYAGEMRGETLILRYGEGSTSGTQTLLPVVGAPSYAPAQPWPSLP